MNLAAVEKIAKAVLYEGYMLYPYRPSSVKNKQRWNFGVLYPESYSETQDGTDPCLSQTECLVQAGDDCGIDLRVRFLHLVTRTIGKLKTPLAELPTSADPDFELIDRLQVGEQVLLPWQEAEEREITMSLSRDILLGHHSQWFTFAPARRLEPVRDEANQVIGVVIRENETVKGSIEVSLRADSSGILKLIARLRNITPFERSGTRTRDEALRYSLLSAHVVLGVSDGEFISLLEPPDSLRALASSCQNLGTWPVLVGDAGERDTMLSSPIILYDYPQIAPESAGDLFDGTEIDEILSLRIMTLTDDEKREMRESDHRARQILDRTESLPAEQFMKLHGVVRSSRSLKREA
jgi:hydrogenase maturation protease